MPDIRVQIPDAQIGSKVGIYDLLQTAKGSAYETVGEEFGLKSSDFWTFGSVVFSLQDVVTVDVIMIRKPERSPEACHRLAEGIKDGVKQFLTDSGLSNTGVLVWIHLKDPEAEFAEVEPS